jgi:hypothetical protein
MLTFTEICIFDLLISYILFNRKIISFFFKFIFHYNNQLNCTDDLKWNTCTHAVKILRNLAHFVECDIIFFIFIRQNLYLFTIYKQQQNYWIYNSNCNLQFLCLLIAFRPEQFQSNFLVHRHLLDNNSEFKNSSCLRRTRRF